MDNDFSIDIRDLILTIRTSDVVVMRFIPIGQLVLFDFRSSEIDGPLVKVVPPCRSVQERCESIARLRPRFAAPERINATWWPRFAKSLPLTGVWDEVLRRIADTGHADAVRRAEEALAEIVTLEVAEQRRAISGEGFRTLWSASTRAR